MSNTERQVHSSNGSDALAIFEGLVQGRMRDQLPRVVTLTMTLRPDIFGALMAAMKAVLFEGILPPTVKQMIVMAISVQNNCGFCASMHTAMLESLGVPEAVIASCAGDPDLAQIPPLYRQILRFALKAAQQPGHVTEEDFQVLRDGGLNEEEILEVAMLASYSNFLNTWTEVADVLPDLAR